MYSATYVFTTLVFLIVIQKGEGKECKDAATNDIINVVKAGDCTVVTGSKINEVTVAHCQVKVITPKDVAIAKTFPKSDDLNFARCLLLHGQVVATWDTYGPFIKAIGPKDDATTYANKICSAKCFNETVDKTEFCLKHYALDETLYTNELCGVKCFNKTDDKKNYCKGDPSGCPPPPKPYLAQLLDECENKPTEADLEKAAKAQATATPAQVKKIEQKYEKMQKKIVASACKIAYDKKTTDIGDTDDKSPPASTTGQPNNCTPTKENCKKTFPNDCKGSGTYVQVWWTGLSIWICSIVWFLKVD